MRAAALFIQTCWSILGLTVVLIILTELGLRAVFLLKDRGAPVSPDRRVIAEGYEGASWPVIHYRELERLSDRWEPYVYFRERPQAGQTINVDAEGLRTTWGASALKNGPGASPRSLKLLLLGGSSLWGYGARDDYTIPSLLARTLHDGGEAIEVRNLAEIGYVSTQELIALVRELQGGYRPDVVLFYDGVNDTTSALLEREAGLTTNEINRRREFNLLHSPPRLLAGLAGSLLEDSGSLRFARAVRQRLPSVPATTHRPLTGDRTEQLAADVVRRYFANLGLASALGREYGFRALFFWQPVVFTKSSLVAFEREEQQKYMWTQSIFRAVYNRIHSAPELRARLEFHDLSGIFADDPHLVYIDYCHTTEGANARIASAMAEAVMRVRPSIERTSR
jgi:lysophospholipase L1-like esterase